MESFRIIMNLLMDPSNCPPAGPTPTKLMALGVWFSSSDPAQAEEDREEHCDGTGDGHEPALVRGVRVLQLGAGDLLELALLLLLLLAECLHDLCVVRVTASAAARELLLVGLHLP